MRPKERGTQIAAAWHELVEALGSGRDYAAGQAKDLGGHARHKITDVRGEAARRTTDAWDALAGKRDRHMWRTVSMTAVGVAIGWAACEFYRKRHDQINEKVVDTVTAIGNEVRDVKESLSERVAVAKSTPGSPVEKAKAAINTKIG